MVLISSGSKKKKPRYACLSEAKASHSKNVGRGFNLCSTPPTQWTVWQPQQMKMSPQGVYGAGGAVRRTAPPAPYTRPTQRLSRPPTIYKLGAENHMLQLNIHCCWWWAYVPETCRAKETSINYAVAWSWHFILFHEEDPRSNNTQVSIFLLLIAVCKLHTKSV